MHENDLNSHVAALSYLVVMLIQRMDNVQDGFAQELIAGIEADKQAAMSASEYHADRFDVIFDKAAAIVRQASCDCAKTSENRG